MSCLTIKYAYLHLQLVVGVAMKGGVACQGEVWLVCLVI